jgi:hypothetical protein
VSHLLELKLVPLTTVVLLVWITGICSTIYASNFYYCVEKSNSSSSSQQDNNSINSNSNNNIMIQVDYSSRRLWWVAFALLSLTQLLEVMVNFVYLLHLHGLPREEEEPTTISSSARTTATSTSRDHFSMHNHELVEEMWADRCAKACQCLSVASCYVFGGQELLSTGAEFGDVARALSRDCWFCRDYRNNAFMKRDGQW